MLLSLFIALAPTGAHAGSGCARAMRGPRVAVRVVHKPAPAYVMSLTQRDGRHRTTLELSAAGPGRFEARFATRSRPRIDDACVHVSDSTPPRLHRPEFRVRALLLAAGLRALPPGPVVVGFAWDGDKLDWDDFVHGPTPAVEGTWFAGFMRRRGFRHAGVDQFDLGPEGRYSLAVARERGWFAHSLFERVDQKMVVPADTQPTNVGLR